MQSGIFQIFGQIIVVLVHLMAYLFLQLQVASLPVPESWKVQALILLSLSLVLGLTLPFIKNRSIILALLGFRGILLVTIGLAQGEYLETECLLTLNLILDACIYLPLGNGVCFATIFTGIMIVIQLFPVCAWGSHLRIPAVIDLWLYGCISFFHILFCVFIRMQHEKHLPVVEARQYYQGVLNRLSRVNLQLQEYAATVARETLLRERKRLGHEIHDTLAYTLTNLVMMLEAAKIMADCSKKELVDQLELARAQASEGLTEVHRVLQDLKPNLLNEGVGLAAIEHLVATFTGATDIKIGLNLGNAPLCFGEEMDLVIYRFVQEGITNALRHGHASQISISFSLMGNLLHIQIRDNGVGIDDPKAGYGLSGMRERIERIGGTLEFSGMSGLGFRLLAIFPV